MAEALSAFERIPTGARPAPTKATAPAAELDRNAGGTSQSNAERPGPEEQRLPEAPAAASRPTLEQASSDGLCTGTSWRQFLHELSTTEHLAPLCAILSRGTFLGSTSNEVHIGFQASTTLRQAKKLGDTPEFLDAAREAFGPDVLLRYEADPDHRGSASLSEELERIRKDHKSQQEQSALEHPAVQQASMLFPGTKIESIEVPELKEIDHVQ
ncbi:MAG TPA: hypothetical protein DIU15_14835 [Deltaproteobacteria bacterium]|nr:hypothetical protein [Deltaproteobacteria bacterium]